MTSKDFDILVDAILESTRDTLCNKAKEYANGDDRLHNFVEAAKLERCTPERALRSFMTKHIVSVYDMIEGLEQGKTYPLELWREKCGDIRNYLILLEALVAVRYAYANEPLNKEPGLDD
jgi:hypothetical protein